MPTSDANKITCSIFIYFGVACIGLLLGSYIAGMMDERAVQERRENQMDACPNCARIRTLKDAAEKSERRATEYSPAPPTLAEMSRLQRFASERVGNVPDPVGHGSAAVYSPLHHHRPRHQNSTSSHSGGSQKSHKSRESQQLPLFNETNAAGIAQDATAFGRGSPTLSPMPSASSSLGSPVTRNILGRQSHTRHVSIDIGNDVNLFAGGMPTTYGSTERQARVFGEDLQAPSTDPVPRTGGGLRRIESGALLNDGFSDYSDDDGDDDYSESSVCSSSSSESSVEEIWDTSKNRIHVFKYIFLTLRLALFNSMVIIAVGCVGFWLIEGFTLIDGWYFTTVLLTTVG